MNELLQKIQAQLNGDRLADNLKSLFCETLRWGTAQGLTVRHLQVGAPLNRTVTAVPIAQISGLPVYRVDWPEDGLPGVTARRAVQRALKPVHAEHLLCYLTANGRRLAFTWARKRPDGRTELRTLSYQVGSPARTTLERLAELAFRLDELEQGEPPITAVTDKLNQAFSVEAVTKRFYQELANWFFWAKAHVRFPLPPAEKDADTYISQSLIRLITRLIFTWFMKEMGLIPRELFDPGSLSRLLKEGEKLRTNHNTIFYKAVLQNLFFATLNQEIDKRQFRKRNKNPHGRDPHRGVTNLYRYEDYFTDPQAFLRLVKPTPFLDGGLFECLDRVYRTEENRSDLRIDGFSDHPGNPLSVPDFLFFGDERTVDLSAAYGKAKYKRTKVQGLIHIFNSYNFTVTESTPLDQEVALDPELAGKVFENLLASYNPETAKTARKATGSYYTPREVVDYMVDEALVAYLASKLSDRESGDIERKLRHLVAYNDEPHGFSPAEVETLIAAIDSLKALDPACGSGAFLMGLLHKLVFVLGKLDPRNEQWERRQIARVRGAIRAAEKIEDAAVRERVLRELEDQIVSIKDAFARNELDYGRKLYLVENCIYGVDIQPIAVQIAKMRFFISLTIDQKVDLSAPNLGIRPLPNLETKFVAANTLISVNKPGQLVLRDTRITAKEVELRRVRERHFSARTLATKAKCRELDAKIRAEISRFLRAGGFPPETTQKLVKWDPYDQNTSADFFDPEWMFGINGGFDIVIGNPPYVRQEHIKELKPLLKSQGYVCYTGTADLYVYFFERGLQLLRIGGILCYVTSNKYLRSAYGQPLRAYLVYATRPRVILDFGDAAVFTSIAYPCILIAEKARHVEPRTFPNPIALAKQGKLEQFVPDRTVRVHTWSPRAPLDRFAEIFERRARPLAQRNLKPDGWRLATPASLRLLEKLRHAGVPLGQYVRGRFYYGIKTGLNKAFVVDRATRERLIAQHPSSAEIVKPFLRGRDVRRWRCEFGGKYLIKIESSENVRHPWSGRSVREAERVFAKTYPAIHAWFQTMRQQLMERYDQGEYFWELRSCDYWREFEQPKIVVPAIADTVNYAPDLDGFYGNDKTSIIVSFSVPFLLAILNSAVSWWITRQEFASRKRGFFEFKPMYVSRIAIPAVPPAEQQSIERLVQKILEAKRSDPLTDVTEWEHEIDQLVYSLYGLTREEIKIVEEESQS